MTIFRGRCKGNNIVVLNTAARLATVRGAINVRFVLYANLRTEERKKERG